MKKFNKDKYLIKLKFKKYKRYLYIGIPCILVLLIGMYFAYSKFSVFKEEEVVRTTVGDFISGDIVITPYIDGEYSKTIPGKNDGYVVDKIVCDNDASASWDNDSWGIMVTNLTKRTKCNVYFKKYSPADKVIAQLDTSGKCPTINSDGTVNVIKEEATDGYVCSAPDAYGTSYYYRGNAINNYVKFGKWSDDTPTSFVDGDGYKYDSLEECHESAIHCTELALAGKDMYWRIVRINGDGTVRVIYDGTSAHANGTASANDQLVTFTSSYNDNAYVGYMYGKIGASTYAETHANINNSKIKTYLDTWYENNIKGTTNEQYIADNIFCNDRSFASNNSGTGAGTSTTYYRWYNFADNSNNNKMNKMMLTCPQKNDAFTVNDINKGNGALTYGVGLVTTDEVVLAGGWSSINENYYLYSGQYYWTMSPRYFDGSYANEYRVSLTGDLDGSSAMYGSTVARQVLNLSSEVLKNGDGSMNDPYHP